MGGCGCGEKKRKTEDRRGQTVTQLLFYFPFIVVTVCSLLVSFFSFLVLSSSSSLVFLSFLSFFCLFSFYSLHKFCVCSWRRYFVSRNIELFCVYVPFFFFFFFFLFLFFLSSSSFFLVVVCLFVALFAPEAAVGQKRCIQ